MEQVRAFKTDDGQVFTDRGKATGHQLLLDIRGIANRSGAKNKDETILALAKDPEALHQTIQAYRRSMASIKAAKTKKCK
jgi:uncharacterized phage protein gp47/JayE